jgi:hypothetical protein
MKHRITIALALVAAAGLAGCSALDPFATAPKEAKPARPGQPAPSPRVAVCYNGLETSAAEARAQAQLQCAKGSVAELIVADRYLQLCPVLLPTHATFACVPAVK